MSNFQLPDLRALIQSQFELRINHRCKSVASLSEKWFLRGCGGGGSKGEGSSKLRGLKAGLLAAACYPTCDPGQLKVAADFLVLLTASPERLVNESEDPLVYDLFDRLCLFRKPSWLERFDQNLDAFRMARRQIAEDRRYGAIPDLESYIALRRYSSGLGMAFDLIEYMEGLDLPESVVEHPALTELRSNAMDIVAWSSDIFSYATSKVTGNTHNLITVLMSERHLTLQGALTCAHTYVSDTLTTFLENVELLPKTWGDDLLDDDVHLYVQGLRDWISGSIHWAFQTERYFGESVNEVREYGWVFVREKSEDATDGGEHTLRIS